MKIEPNVVEKNVSIVLGNASNSSLLKMCGPLDINLKTISNIINTKIIRFNNKFTIIGSNNLLAEKAICFFYEQSKYKEICKQDIILGMSELNNNIELQKHDLDHSLETCNLDKLKIRPRTKNQYTYLCNILKKDITFGVGPAGTGKTILAVACAVNALESHAVEHLVLTRPAVEAGEKLGFLPGDLEQKINPYLRPLYDALYNFIGIEQVEKLFEKQIIEIAPLAYMRGRTLNNAFIILDEAQNTTPEQMKMFLTRIGLGSKAVITGDPSQIDLPLKHENGLDHAISILNKINEISINSFTKKDILRHPLIAKIVTAYELSSKK
ncbi:PhoH-like phosphate starvation-inducible protein [Candidatus Kinetoplastibacterium blastocrithidii TCC012E]|uniref:PhoH-like protein n=1 Tax=Candidatus Kinetoplastidibacterium blastocrithidiae TCC012E TaxID=1208922 RepID=M1LAQ2_9PROT|nr:PhoH family protein [Candidatus Kinetoplastibacterium blastocrithidii]AFZ83467.1 phosphate starvation-inducible protein PhoH and related protein [Candidatus Kinetoplastibacterium blastocrithidii (ex Strigomonas culicis)]AGF49563.1 PhoH-like phosphate starvation-inducible protein [Candidatus Kinetoplastibacterium blastocrithidii TCC012E]